MEWVNKQAVIEEIAKYLNEVDKDNGTALNGAKAMLIVKKAEEKEVIISKPKAKWQQDGILVRCSNCGVNISPLIISYYDGLPNFCAECGALMENGEDMGGE